MEGGLVTGREGVKMVPDIAAKNRGKHKGTFEEATTDDYELRDEYDLAKLTIVAKGRYAPERRMGTNMVSS